MGRLLQGVVLSCRNYEIDHKLKKVIDDKEKKIF